MNRYEVLVAWGGRCNVCDEWAYEVLGPFGIAWGSAVLWAFFPFVLYHCQLLFHRHLNRRRSLILILVTCCLVIGILTLVLTWSGVHRCVDLTRPGWSLRPLHANRLLTLRSIDPFLGMKHSQSLRFM
jgi:cytochrome c biogenesis factor